MFDRVVSGCFLSGLMLLLSGCAGEDGVEVIKLGHGWDASHPVHHAMVYMGERLVEKSGGTMRMDIYPSEQLGSERECLELLQIGSLGMTKVSAAALEGFAPAFRVFSVPYLFRNDEHRFRVQEGEVGKRLLLAGEKYWLRGLCYYDAGSRSFYTKNRPVRTPADLSGLKVRTMESPSAVQMVNQLGGSATPISWGELYSALQQGVVDAAENNPPSFHLSRHYEVCKYYTLDEHTAIPDVVLMSTKVWDQLTAEQQEWLQEAADESAEYQKVLWREATDEALRAVQEAGVEVIYPDKAPFAHQVEPMYESYRSQPETYEAIQQIRAIQ
jgi:tripartite ATP-independent transporter DctP family solute receptor